VPARPKTFGFEERAKLRPKPISQVKMEQDLELKRRNEEKEATQTFKANKVRMQNVSHTEVHFL
jgi:hypothetical protein